MVNNAIRMETLSKQNYETSKIQVEAILIKNETWEYDSGEKQKPAVTDVGDELKAAEVAYAAWLL